MGIWGFRAFILGFTLTTVGMTSTSNLFAVAGSISPSGTSGSPTTSASQIEEANLGCSISDSYFGNSVIYPVKGDEESSKGAQKYLFSFSFKSSAALPRAQALLQELGALPKQTNLDAHRTNKFFRFYVPLNLEDCQKAQRILKPDVLSVVKTQDKYFNRFWSFDSTACAGGKGMYEVCSSSIESASGHRLVYLGESMISNSMVFGSSGRYPPPNLHLVPGYIGELPRGDGSSFYAPDVSAIAFIGLSDISSNAKDTLANLLTTQFGVAPDMIGDLDGTAYSDWSKDTRYVQVVLSLAQLSEVANIANVASVEAVASFGGSGDPMSFFRQEAFHWLLAEPLPPGNNSYGLDEWASRPHYNFQVRASGLIARQDSSNNPVVLDGTGVVVGVSDYHSGFDSVGQVNASLTDNNRYTNTNLPVGCNEPASCTLSYAHGQSVMSIIGSSNHENMSPNDEDPLYSNLKIGRGILPNAAVQFNSMLVTNPVNYGNQILKMTRLNHSTNGYRPAVVISKAWGLPSGAGPTEYAPESARVDEWHIQNNVLMIQSAGNQGTAPGVYAFDAVSKNSLVVGAVRHSNTLSNMNDDIARMGVGIALPYYANTIPSTPSYGIGYDGSIVPQIVSYTDGMMAAYGEGSETFAPFYNSSAAAAAVTGNAAAMVKLFASPQADGLGYFKTALATNSASIPEPNSFQLTAMNAPHAPTLKALMIHGANPYELSKMDRGTQGFGRLDVSKYSPTLRENYKVVQGNRSGAQGNGVLTISDSNPNPVQTISVSTTSFPTLVGATRIRATLVWQDAPQVVVPGLPASRLVNNLDLTANIPEIRGYMSASSYKGNCRINSTNITPNTLNCNHVDAVNNVEQVNIALPAGIPSGATITFDVRVAELLVDMTSAAGYNTPYSLVISWEKEPKLKDGRTTGTGQLFRVNSGVFQEPR